MYGPNNNYGFATAIKRYTGWSIHAPLPVLLPHGIAVAETFVHPCEIRPGLPVMSWPEYRDAAFKNVGLEVIPSACPFLYALALFGGSPVRSTGVGTLFMPAHSTACCDTDMNWDELADSLSSMPDECKPVTVCIHWQDEARGRHIPFVNRGYRVVTAGKLQDQTFLYRLIALFKEHKWVAGNEIGSSTLYAIATGRPFFLWGTSPGSRIIQKDFVVAPKEDSIKHLTIISSVVEERRPIDSSMRDMAAYYLGADRKKTPVDLLWELKQASRR
jgi:hypothetical protein